jgi:hypothetical protein
MSRQEIHPNKSRPIRAERKAQIVESTGRFLADKFLILFLITILNQPTLHGGEKFDFCGYLWTRENGRIDTIEEKEAFSGLAYVDGLTMKNGTIEWEMWFSGARSYAGVIFRRQNNGDFEEFYIRPHKCNGLNYDAFQYTPVFNGVSCWQLFHGPGYTREASIPSGEWLRFRLEVVDDRARVSVIHDSGEVITMMIDKLELAASEGRIGIKTPIDGSAWISGVKVYDSIMTPFPEPHPATPGSPGIITEWEVSNSIPNNFIDPSAYYRESGITSWTRISSENNGLINLTKFVTRDMTQPGWVYARTFLVSSEPTSRVFSLGYSDNVTLFLNGNPVYTGTNGFTTRDPSYAGLIGYFDKVYLMLDSGRNEITLLVGEQFGGWGFMMRDASAIYNNTSYLNTVTSRRGGYSYPESVAADTETGDVYVSIFTGEKGGSVIKISQTLMDPITEIISGLANPTGIIVVDEKLFITCRGHILVVDKKNGQFIERILVKGSKFLNDISADEKRRLYITDSEASIVFRIENGTIEEWLDSSTVSKPNAIDYSEGKIFIGCSGSSEIISVDTETKESTFITRIHENAIIDGLKVLKDGAILIGDHAGYLYLLEKSGNLRLLLNTYSAGLRLADFDFIKEGGFLIIPGLYSNYIGVFQLKKPNRP